MKASTSFSPRPVHGQMSGVWTWSKQRRRLIGLAAIVVLGLALGWHWLAAIGALPFLLFALPCALMLGRCMNGMGSHGTGNSCSQDAQTTPPAGPNSITSPASPPAGSSHQRIEEKDHA